MYVKHQIDIPKPMSKVQAVRWLKSSRAKDWANQPEWVKHVMNRHKNYAVNTFKRGIYTARYPYQDSLINAHNHLKVPCDEYWDFESGNSYGVCDGVQNFLEVFDEELKSIPEKVFVILTPVFKDCQPEHGGWRWHKWGPYIGYQNPRYEYLYDEEDIDIVWLYHIYKVKGGS